MKIDVGTNVKQINVIEEYGFDYVGHEFEITKVNDTVIMGKGIEVGVGFGIDTKEFAKYFEIIKNKTNEYCENTNGIKLIRNGMATIVILPDGSKGISKCLPEDRYDEELGYNIAFTKAQIKSYTKQLQRLSK